jgi:hypothetical protein
MRKLRIREAVAAAVVVLLLNGCHKDAVLPSETVLSNDFSLTYTPSVNKTFLGNEWTVLPFDGQQTASIPYQITDNQFFTTKTLDGRMEGDSLDTTPIFSIFFFDAAGQEQTQDLNRRELTERLREVGLTQNAAFSHAERIFGTADCSPTYLVEIAERIAPTLPAHEEGLYAAEVRKPTITPSFTTMIFERPAKRHWVYGIGETPQSPVKRVNLTLGVAGSLMARGNSKVEMWFKDGAFRQFNPQGVRMAMHQIHGDTVGEVLFSRLILGELTEQAVWTLFQKDILRCMYPDMKDKPLKRLFFRYNYLVIKNGEGRIGYTIYDMDGAENTDLAY